MGLNKSTLSEQIYQILRNDILTQKIPCGEKLTLKVLQERFQVSSTPIREALTRLTQDQLVSYYSNVGVRVINFTADDLREIYTFMGDLDGLAIRYASASPDQEKLQAEVTEILEKECAAAKAADVQTWNRYSDEFHLVFLPLLQQLQTCRVRRTAAKRDFYFFQPVLPGNRDPDSDL